MLLADVIAQLVPSGARSGPRLPGGLVVSGLTPDVQRVLPGTVFVALPERQRLNPHESFAAVERGATAVICEADVVLPGRTARIEVASSRQAFAQAAAAFFDHPDRRLELTAVRGAAETEAGGTRRSATNVAHLLAGLLAAGGEPVARFSELGCELAGRQLPAPLSELDAFQVFELLAQFVRGGGTRCVLELSPATDALLGAMSGVRMVEMAGESAPGDLCHWRGSRLEIAGRTVCTRLVGVDNLAALRAAWAGAATDTKCAARRRGAIPTLAGTRGFLEPINAGQPFGVFVDAARTAGELGDVLRDVRRFHEGRVLLVTGAPAGFTRDERQRAGAAAARADRVFVTADDPGCTSAELLAADVQANGAGASFVVEPDRHRAINRAVAAARPGDVVILAGKAHRNTQAAGGSVTPFDDRRHALQALAMRGFGGAEV